MRVKVTLAMSSQRACHHFFDFSILSLAHE